MHASPINLLLMNKELKYPVYAALLVIVGMFAGYKLHEGAYGLRMKEVAKDVDKFKEAVSYVEENYVDVPNHQHLVDDAITGMLEGLDPHSFYIPPVENQAMEEQMEGSFEGIGIEFNILDDTLYVVAPISGGPSEQAGLQSGDKIVSIEGEIIAGKHLGNSDVMKKLKGKKGTKVNLEVMRGGNPKLLAFEITRDKIPLFSVDFSYMIEDKTGYIRVTRFAKSTHEEFLEHLKKLKDQGMENLVLDLRDNPGGYMDQAELLADEFLGKGKLVVYTEGRSSRSNNRYEATNSYREFEKGALIVLMNFGSASASEIVAGAIQDWDRGLIVGVRSFGKGLVQTQKDFTDGSAMRTSVASLRGHRPRLQKTGGRRDP